MLITSLNSIIWLNFGDHTILERGKSPTVPWFLRFLSAQSHNRTKLSHTKPRTTQFGHLPKARKSSVYLANPRSALPSDVCRRKPAAYAFNLLSNRKPNSRFSTPRSVGYWQFDFGETARQLTPVTPFVTLLSFMKNRKRQLLQGFWKVVTPSHALDFTHRKCFWSLIF